MKKSYLVGITALLTLALLAGASGIVVLKVKVQVANVHSEPASDSSTIKRIAVGTLLEAKTKLGDWYEILITDEEGEIISAYIHAMVVDVIRGETAPPPEPQPETLPAEKTTPQAAAASAPLVPSVKVYPKGGFRVLGGLTSANVSTSPIPGLDVDQYKSPLAGFTGGFGYDSGSRVAVVVDVLYLQKGAKFKGNYYNPQMGANFDFVINSTISTISAPIMLKFRFMPGSTPYILGGGEIAFITSNKLKYTITELNSGQTLDGTEDLIDGTNSIDYGLVFGAGYELNTRFIPLFIECCYS